MANFLILNGPNLNLLGQREPAVYGHTTLQDIHDRLADLATDQGHSVDFFQSNAEHEIVSKIHLASDHKIDFIIINPAAFTHTSIALRDALLGVQIPFIEVHLSNIFSREEFRHHSYLSDIAVGVISGLGANGYQYALQAGIEHIKHS